LQRDHRVDGAHRHLEPADAALGVEREQVDALQLEPCDAAAELERQLAALLPLAVVGEALDDLEDQPEQVLYERGAA
jgi:hypothetical protein